MGFGLGLFPFRGGVAFLKALTIENVTIPPVVSPGQEIEVPVKVKNSRNFQRPALIRFIDTHVQGQAQVPGQQLPTEVTTIGELATTLPPGESEHKVKVTFPAKPGLDKIKVILYVLLGQKIPRVHDTFELSVEKV